MIFVILALCLITPAVLGWFCARRDRWKWRLLAALLLMPVAAYTLWFATLPPSDEPFWVWWYIGLLYLSLPLGVWLVSGAAGFAVGHLKDASSR